MLVEYYSIRLKDAEPGKGLLHTTQNWDEVKSSLKHFKDKYPDNKVVAFKHELKKGPMGVTFKRKQMFGEETSLDEVAQVTDRHKVIVTVSDPNHPMVSKRKDTVMKKVNVTATGRDEAKTKAENFYKKKGYKVHDSEYHSKLVSEEKQMKTFTEATRSFKTLMRSIEDKKSIKNLRVPSPAERKAEAERFAATQKKPEPVKEAIAVPPAMGDTIHSVKHGADTYTVHDMGNPRSSSRFKVRKNGVLQSNHASKMNAMNWLASRTDSTESKGNI